MQTRWQSLVEATINIAIGFGISVGVWQVLAIHYGYDMPLSRNLEITTIFTVVSILRAYGVRRLFNHIHRR